LVQVAAYNGSAWVSPDERSAKAAVRGETVESYAKRWIAQRNVKPRTRIGYTDSLTKHVAPKLGEIGIGALSADDVNRWHAKTLTDKPTARKTPTACFRQSVRAP
jgi:hypothetical protein